MERRLHSRSFQYLLACAIAVAQIHLLQADDKPSIPRLEPRDPAETGRPGPDGLDDVGWWLVDLIRHTVQPDYWDTAGGPGTVVYYGPSRALVIRGSWRIHEEVADLLSSLR